MATSPKDLYEAALALDDAERAELVGMLLETLDSETEEGVEAAWVSEIEKRMQELDSGAVKAIPWSEVRARLHQSEGG